MSRFTGKSIIVTGSSTGIGRAAAVLFAREGGLVTIHGRKVDALEETKQAMLSAGSSEDKINVVVGDITSEETQKALVDSTVKKFGKLDVLVNNAGAAPADPEHKQKFEASHETYQRTMDINVNSVMQLIKVARSHLIASQGEIVNISSIAALKFGYDTNPYYSMAKAALDQFTRAIAVDLIAHKVRVNCVNPGVVVTKFIQNMGVPEEGSNKIYNYFASKPAFLPIGELGQPDHIATVIAFLAHRPSSFYILGQCIVADGGSSLIMAAMSENLMTVLSS